MTNLNILETFRTKEELINYFKENGQNITEEEIKTLKQSYEQTETDSNALAMQQLDEVAGGVFEMIGRFFHGAMKLLTGVLAVQAVYHPVPGVLEGRATDSRICFTMNDGKHCYGTIKNPDSTSMFDNCIPQDSSDPENHNYQLLCFDQGYLERHPGSTCAPRVGYNNVFDRDGNLLQEHLREIPINCENKHGTLIANLEQIANAPNNPYLQLEM